MSIFTASTNHYPTSLQTTFYRDDYTYHTIQSGYFAGEEVCLNLITGEWLHYSNGYPVITRGNSFIHLIRKMYYHYNPKFEQDKK